MMQILYNAVFRDITNEKNSRIRWNFIYKVQPVQHKYL